MHLTESSTKATVLARNLSYYRKLQKRLGKECLQATTLASRDAILDRLGNVKTQIEETELKLKGLKKHDNT